MLTILHVYVKTQKIIVLTRAGDYLLLNKKLYSILRKKEQN